jgi:Secretion system C-terminal sorting domain
MKKLLATIYIVTVYAATAFAQSGCTDTAANNYDPNAITNDGSCTYNVTHATAKLIGALAANINESSGLTYSYDVLWTHNDSGNPPQIFKIDTTDASTIQTVDIDNYPNTDWEDIADDSAYIYIGNFGNNDGDRKDLAILKILKSDIGSGSLVHVTAQAIAFSYTDQKSFVASKTNNFDCESLISVGDSLYIFTKDRGDSKSREYCLPKTPGTYSISPIDTLNAGGLVTGADYNPKTKEIALVGYLSGHTGSFLWFLSDYQGHHFFTGNKRRIEIGNNNEWQTEGVCYDHSGTRLFISCESDGNIPASLFVLDKNSYVVTSVPTYKKSPIISVFPNPANSTVNIQLETPDAVNITLTSLNGQEVLCENYAGTYFIQLTTSGLAAGAYLLKVQTEDGSVATRKIIKK